MHSNFNRIGANLVVADVDGNGKVDKSDAERICDYCNGIIDEI